MQKELNKYYKQIYNTLPISKEKKKKYLEELKYSIEDYMEKNEGVTIRDIESHFGTPESIALVFINESNEKEISTKITSSKLIKKMVLISLILILSLALLGVGYAIYDTYRTNHGFFSEESIE